MNESAIENAVAADVGCVRVDLDTRGYDILIGGGLLARATDYLGSVLRQKRIIVITDATVAKLYLEAFAATLDNAGIAHDSIVVSAGEDSKSFAQVEALVEELLDKNVERATTIVALGGGVVGDLAGFAASITLRGLDFVQIPTTLLAQVDSSVGGKTGVNTRHGKNLVGSFHQPRLVIADTSVLDTLPRRELLAGYAETVKYGLIGDAAFFAWLEENGAAVIAGNDDARRHAVETSCRAKAAVVVADERETGRRALLNLGHTFGHAIEAELGYDGRLLHGEAVAMGMVLAFEFSVALALCPPDDAQRVVKHFETVGLPTNLAALGLNADALVTNMHQDKKVSDGQLTFVLARRIGEAFVSSDVPETTLREFLDRALA